MEKSMSVFKRLLAMLLVFAMVIGYMPAFSFATDAVGGGESTGAPAAREVTPFVVTVTRTEYKEAEPGTPEDPGEEPAEPEVAYTYTASLKVGDQEVDAADVEFAWTYGQNSEHKVEGSVAENVSQDYEELVLECTYDCITLTQLLEEADFTNESSCEIKLSATMDPGQVKLGASVSAPEEATTQNFAGKWVVTEWNADYVEGGYVVNAAEGNVRLATLQLQGQAAEDEKPVVYLELDWNAAIVPVEYTASIEVEEGQREWYNSVNAVVTVTGDVPVKDSSFVQEAVLVDGAAFAANWTTQDNGKSWQSDKISLTTTGDHTISVGKTDFNFDIDTVQPTVEIEEAYYTTLNGEKVTVIRFSYEVGKSGVEKITIYDGEKIVADNLDPEATSRIIFGWIENPKVIVLGKNGLANEVIPVPQPPLTVTVEGPAANTILGTVGDVVYAPNGELTVVVEGAAQDGTYKLDAAKSAITAMDEAGNEIKAGDWTFADGKWTATVSLANGLSELSVAVTDAKNREATTSCDQKYAVDREAPVITASRDIDPVNTVGTPGSADYVEYYDNTVTYHFTIEDTLLGDVKSYVVYQLDGKETDKVAFDDGEAEVKVENGQKLTSLTVYGCDASGNETTQVVIAEDSKLAETWPADKMTYNCNVVVDTEDPEVSVTVNKNVQAFYTDATGRVYAVLKNGAYEVTLTVTVKDENLTADCLTADGTEWELTYNAEENVYEAVAVFRVVVNEHATGVLEYGFSYKDLANRTSNEDLIVSADPTTTEGLTSGTNLKKMEDSNSYAGQLHIDRRSPSSTDELVPKVVVTPSVTPVKIENKLDLFKGAFNFTMEVYDRTNGSADSGVRYVGWTLKGSDSVSTPANGGGFGADTNVDGIYTIPVNLNATEVEVNEIVLTVWVKDHVLNQTTYTYKFAIDTKDPEISYSFDGGDATNENHYNGERTLHAVVTDLNLKDAKLIVNGNAVQTKTAESDTITFEPYVISQGGTYEIEIVATDLAGHTSTEPIDKFVIDQDSPEVNVTKTVEEGKGLTRSTDGVDYYNGEVTYTVTIADEFLSAEPGEKNLAVLTYTFEDGTSHTVELGGQLQWTAVQYLDGKTYYQHEFTVQNGQVLTGMTIQAMDNAGNPMEAVSGDVPFENKDGIWTYTGNAVVVDKTAPVITVTKDQNFVHQYTVGEKTYDYYDAEVAYTITITDNFMNNDVVNEAVMNNIALYNITDDKGNMTALNPDMIETVVDGKNVLTITVPVTEGQVLESMKFLVQDNAGNIATFLTDEDAAAAYFVQQQNGLWMYNGNAIVVDTVAPKAELKFSDNVDSFYMNGSTVYVVLKAPAVGDSGVPTEWLENLVTMTLTVKDKNLAIDNNDVNGVKDRTPDDGFNWEGETPVNMASNSITYTANSGEANPDGTHTFKIDVQITDLAGHALTKENLDIFGANKTPALGETKPGVQVTEGGNIAFDVSVDRRRPTSGDTDVPTITIDPIEEDLFNGSFTFDMHVTDGEDNTENSGLNYVKWTVSDKNGVVANYDHVESYVDEEGNIIRTLAGDYVIDITLPGNGESNDVLLSIEAMDNVGNKVNYEKTFGVDNLAPRVTITQSNKDVRNGYYFKDDQVITVVIEDLNFEPTTSSVTTEVDFSDWQRIGDNKYSTVLTYDSNGEYTFAMQTTDQAGNAAVIDYTTDLVALQSFTIDKTAPVVNVTKTVEEGKGLTRSTDGVDYYDGEVTYTVTISDAWLTDAAGATQVAEFTYTLEDGTVKTVTLPASEDGWVKDAEKDTYSYSFTLTDGQVLTDMTLRVVDNANNPMEAVSGNVDFAVENGTWTYTGKDVVVDKTAPVITVVKNCEPVNQYGVDGTTRDYYDAEVTYTITVKDNFMNSGVAENYVKYFITNDQGKTTEEPAPLEAAAGVQKLASEDTFTYEFTVYDGQVLEGIEFLVKDNAGNAAVFPNAENDKFALVDGVWTYNGNPIVVDMTAPTAMITFSENVDSFYMKGDTIYAVLTDPVKNNEAGELSGEPTETVTVTIEVTDNNLAIDNEDDFGVKDGTKEDAFTWRADEINVNQKNTIEYVAASEAVAIDGTAIFTVDVQVLDLAGHYLLAEDVTINETGNDNNLGKTVPKIPGLGEDEELSDGKIAFTVNVDRRRPTSEGVDKVPTISVEPVLPENIVRKQTASKLDLFSGAFSFALNVNDNEDSGVQYVKWSIVDPNGVVDGYETEKKLTDNGQYTIDVPLVMVEGEPIQGESNEVKLTIEAMDNVGNIIVYVKTFGVDTLKPRIEYAYTYGKTEATPTNGMFYNRDVTVTVTIEDLNLDESFKPEDYITITKYSAIPDLSAEKELPVESVWAPEGLQYIGDGKITYTFSMPFEEDGVYGVTTAVQDLAINANEELAQNNVFILDKTAPVIDVTKTVEEGKGLIDTTSGVDYYNGEVTYTVTIADEFLSAEVGKDTVNAAVLTYTFEDGTSYTVELPASEDDTSNTVELDDDAQWTVFQYMDGKTYYQYEFTVKNDQVLTGMTLQAMDNASNPAPATAINCNDPKYTVFGYTGPEVNVHIYTGNPVVVDKVAPEITVTKVGEAVHQYSVDGTERDYHDAEVTYTITVKDNFMNYGVADYHKVMYSITNDQGVTDNVTKLMTAKHGEGLKVSKDTFTYEFTVYDGQVLEALAFQAEDNAGNVATFTNDEAAVAAQFEQNGKTWIYNGNPIVVDMTAPTAKLEFSDNVDAFYTNGNTVYVILEEPVVGNSGETSSMSDQVVTMTLTVEDLNLAIDNNDVYGVKDGSEDDFNWSGNTPVNMPTTLTYTAKSGNVNPDGTHTFEIDLQIIDLAGHALLSRESESEQKLELVPANGNSKLGGNIPKVDVDGDGNLKFVVSTDRLRPTSEDDKQAPTITIDPSITPTTTADGLDLFNGAFTFALHVTDGEDSDLNSGINYVKWTVEDKNGVVESYETVKNYEDEYGVVDRVLKQDYTINVPLKVTQGESNDVKLTIEAMDNVGNTIVFEKIFGVDNLAPRVKITQSNHSVQNDFYFKDNQEVTVTIEDLNFEPTTSSVTTEVAFNGWHNVGGNVYKTVLTYNRDGDYTFAMQTTDRANNSAVIDYTTGLTALQKFTIDKTAPIINVTFNPAVAVDTDGDGVQYFDENRSVTVTITEHNFRSTDVTADLGSKNALSAWRSNGDTHTAGDVFYEGNNYKVSVQYTDLAGNPAQSYTSPTFSVDLGAPTIEMSKGDMKYGQPNIVPGDLLLGFTINDKQSNLKDFSVEVLFMDSSFKQTKVEGAEYYTLSGQGDRTNGYIDFTNIERVKANDGIYTVRITAVDYAGHVVTLMSDLMFSLNRFGSTFYTGDDFTKDFLTVNEDGIVFRKDVEQDLVIKEINPNRVWQDANKTVEGSLITVSVNSKVVTLTKGEEYQYSVKEMGTGSNKWYEYTYTISKDVFRSNGELVDGEYTIVFYSEDEAENKNTNESNEGSVLTHGMDDSYTSKIVFTLDHKKPVVTILGISNGQKIREKNQSVEINIADDTKVFVEVYINEKLVEEVTVIAGQPVDSDWFCYDPTSGICKLNMSEKYEPQDVKIIVKDSAGNQIEVERTGIMLTENLWYQYINSTPAKFATIVILLALFMLIMVLVKKRKQKKEAEAAAAAKN